MNRRIDPTLVITLLLLITGGLLMIYSASAPNQSAGNDLRYVTKQIIAIVIDLDCAGPLPSFPLDTFVRTVGRLL